MSNNPDFLFEIGTEELPPKELSKLAAALADGITSGLKVAGLPFKDTQTFAAPRRLAVHIVELAAMQPNRVVEKKGPALNTAFDVEGKPSKACEGFARSCGVSVAQLEKLETPQGAWLIYRSTETGKALAELIPSIIEKALAELPVAKTMRWGNHSQTFVRPAHWILLLHGNAVIEAEILGIKSGNVTYGHRFHHSQQIVIKHPREYEQALEQGKVIADFEKRKAKIIADATTKASAVPGNFVADDHLLNEITGIVEWPVALVANFEQRFLTVPKEALISAMQNHQKCFPLQDHNNELLPHFIFISNIESKDTAQVITGNERVMRARLADAEFFYQQDLKQPLADRCEGLKNVLFQAKLGTLFDKSQRVARLAKIIASQIWVPLTSDESDNPEDNAERAGLLSKADLLTSMVGEFPELQGIMGDYYACHNGEDERIAKAIREHYLPRFASDELPTSLTGCAVALADRFDTLIGLFGINQPPTGSKDPFGLRRAALGIIRILVDKRYNLDLFNIIEYGLNGYSLNFEKSHTVQQVQEFILERLKPWYQEKGVSTDKILSVLAAEKRDLLLIDYRIEAVKEFCMMSEAVDLIEANKRVKNLLGKADNITVLTREEFENLSSFLIEDAEKKLFYEIEPLYKREQVSLIKQSNRILNAEYYKNNLVGLSKLREPINYFFETVMVNVENQALKKNRLSLLAAINYLFSYVADISALQIENINSEITQSHPAG